MISAALLPGFSHWGAHLEDLLARPEALWIYGPSGAGASTLAKAFAGQRGVAWMDATEAAPALAWLATHPRGVVAASFPPPAAGESIALRLPGLDEDPACILPILEAMAAEEGVAAALPPALAALPCPGNLRELRNRLVRWKLLGQLPVQEPAGPPQFEAEDLASNLHALERFLLHRALRRAYGNRMEAARRLGVSRRQVYLLIRRHGDPVRGEPSVGDLPQRLRKRHAEQNSSPEPEAR